MAVNGKANGKRTAAASHGPNKKQKLPNGKSAQKPNKSSKSKGKGKEKDKAVNKQFIEIPDASDASNEDDLSEQDMEFLTEHKDAGRFLQNLDRKGISRSKQELDRIHKLSKPAQRPRLADDTLPSIDSHSEEEGSWSSGLDEHSASEAPASDDEDGIEVLSDVVKRIRKDSDNEMSYEAAPRVRRKSWEDSDSDKAIERLPVKLANGRIQRTGERIVQRALAESSEEESDSEENFEDQHVSKHTRVDDVATGARFGRPAVVDVVSTSSRKARLQGAREQIAGICQDIIADPENSLGLLRRLHTFSLSTISTPCHPEPVANDIVIRKLAFLSQLAVFRDIIPGYRIRALTDKEKEEKVSQMVQRTRDFEQGLVSVYQSYLRNLETELKANSELSETALQCICRLLTDVTHFNFRTNLIGALVARLSKKSWTEQSQLCLDTLKAVLKADITGEPSLEIVRLLNRMIKERRYNVHPNVMFCLLHLRLKTELGGIRASQTKAEQENGPKAYSKGRAAARRAKGKRTDQPHLSKKTVKQRKETREIEEEMREADAEVDQEERSTRQTETLKLLFVLYFRILKNDKPTSLLPAALQGISRFAHLVNIDFFKDLLQVLRDLVSNGHDDESGAATDAEDDGDEGDNTVLDCETTVQPDVRTIHLRLHCIVTAFELLTGQGEALNIDLTDFINRLYAMILPLSVMPGIESEVPGTTSPTAIANTSSKIPSRGDTPANMLFRALNLAFSSRVPSFAKPPPWRSAAFATRLVIGSIHFPPATAKRALAFVEVLFAKEPKLEALLSTEDRVVDGIYRPDVDDPQLCNPFGTSMWELHLLAKAHVDPDVRQLAGELARNSREGR